MLRIQEITVPLRFMGYAMLVSALGGLIAGYIYSLFNAIRIGIFDPISWVLVIAPIVFISLLFPIIFTTAALIFLLMTPVRNHTLMPWMLACAAVLFFYLWLFPHPHRIVGYAGYFGHDIDKSIAWSTIVTAPIAMFFAAYRIHIIKMKP